ncbi:A24 family peptidase [Alisedimentitalea sp. MJ-SS2]|uniref:prepilin peptidase n=1 Tax=Aliisedimentitalea sp. MJ-SS2 TaxID=3049795 RepID=UPI00290A2114|nr:A24 family peptidase [Alisedimentitalea sp. MJ-SS2]MDU8925810.1 A24 family peptidase [Alisedimentitalea sp. MJ-SS2]
MALTDPYILMLLVFSPFAGSFLALAADRLPRDESIILPRSHCRSCKIPLSARDLIPILSFALTRGRCRHCGAPIPSWLVYFELTTVGLALFAVVLAPTPMLAWGYAVFLWLLVTLAAADLHHFRLPDLLTGALLIVALLLAWQTGLPSMTDAIWGAAIGLGSFLALRLAYFWLRGREGLGLGDVKLMAGLGAALGPEMLPIMVLMASLAALASALIGALMGRSHAMQATRPLPFGAALAAATGLLWLTLRLPV